MPSINLELLEQVVGKLGGLLSEVVFVGGVVTELLVTDASAFEVRPTMDVDVIIDIASYAEYTMVLAEQLRQCGFSEDMSLGAPLCWWTSGSIVLDVMPVTPQILGFGNPWYTSASRSATNHTLPSRRQIRVIDAPHFLATKLFAFGQRGKNDLYLSKDLKTSFRLWMDDPR